MGYLSLDWSFFFKLQKKTNISLYLNVFLFFSSFYGLHYYARSRNMMKN